MSSLEILHLTPSQQAIYTATNEHEENKMHEMTKPELVHPVTSQTTDEKSSITQLNESESKNRKISI